MRKRRAVLRDFLACFLVYGVVLAAAALIAYVVLKDIFYACAVFSVLFWAFWALRVWVKLKSRRAYRIPRVDNGTFIFYMIVVAAVFITAEYFTMATVQPLPVIAAVFLCLCRMAALHMESVDDTLDMTAAFSVQPVREIRRFNNQIIAVFVLLALALCAGVYFSLNGKTVDLWPDALTALFTGPEYMPGPEQTARPGTPADMEDLTAGETPLFFVVLGWIIRHFYAALAVVGLVYFAYAIFINMKGFRFGKRKVIYENGDLSEAIAPVGAEKTAGRFRTGKIPGDPVRRAFYKKVKKYRSLVEKSDTAKEMAGKIWVKEDINALAEAYQAVRYGKK